MIATFAWIAHPMPLAVTVYALATLLTLTASAALALLWKLQTRQRDADRIRRHLRQQHQYVQSLLDALPFPVMAKDRDGVYALANLASRRECGIDIHAIGKTSLALPPQGLFAGEGGATNRQFNESSLAVTLSGQEQKREITYVGSDGFPREGLWWDCPIYAEDSGVIGSIGVLQDITSFREIEAAARTTERHLQDIVQHIPVVVFTVHHDHDQLRRLTFLAGDLRALFGIDPESLVETRNVVRDWPILKHVHPEDQTSVRTLLFQATRRPRAGSLDFRAYGDGGLRWLHLTMAPRKLPDGSMQWTGYLIDTTSINEHNEVLRAARDAAERASKAKADFLATMSHEIRTPMNGVVGMIELLGHTSLDAEQQSLLHAVEDSAGVLLQVLNDVLDFSKLEAGNLRLDEAPFDPRMLIDNIVSSMSAHMHRNGLQVQVSVDAALAGTLRGDSVRVRQILLNLLNNASKFTEHGRIAVGMQVLGDDGTSQRLRLTVSDTGIGIAADKQSMLFTPFAQAESWTTRRYGGTGLGLAICRHLVHLMDGSIQLTSEQGVGTTVAVDLQLPIGQREADRPSGLAGRHAVVRVALTDTATALVGYLVALGITTETIPPSEPMRTGLSANLLFVDSMDEQVRSIAAQAIVVDSLLTSRGAPFMQDDVIHLNANPLKWQSVIQACVMALEPLNPRKRDVVVPTSPAAPSPAFPDHERGRILVAEDHPVGRALARRQFELLGWPCDVVSDGRAAFEALCNGHYTMLLTDCQMPVMDGYELATAWRQREVDAGGHEHMPIIAVTASALDRELLRCRTAGMDDYLSKPVQLQKLRQMIETWMPHATSANSPKPMTADEADEPITRTPLASPNDLLGLMLETSKVDMGLLDRALADADIEEAGRRLHRMLGAFQLFSESPLLDDGRRLLDELEETEAETVLPKLRVHADQLRKLLSDLSSTS